MISAVIAINILRFIMSAACAFAVTWALVAVTTLFLEGCRRD